MSGVSGNGRGAYSGAGMNMEDIFSQFGDIFGDDVFGVGSAPAVSGEATFALN